jgi:chitosanase
MFLSKAQKSVIERTINAFETGTSNGKYDAISRYHDGPHKIRQITYGRSQTTEYGNLRQLISDYADSGGKYSSDLKPYVKLIGVEPLVENQDFIELLKKAGAEDPIMTAVQDAFFDRVYFSPARRWADENGFLFPLSLLVIYDSYIHSGQIFWFLRKRFAGVPPGQQGNEKEWTRSYTTVRDTWLRTHSDKTVRASAYRTKDLLAQIDNDNWDLSQLPLVANGVNVGPSP